MIELIGSELRVTLIDPANDAGRLGSRYCTGGYIWQIDDQAVGPLLTGPEWPHPNPSAFNGQGLPESFRHRTRAGVDLTWRGSRGLALGIGELEQQADGTVQVITPCDWEITRQSDRVVYRTRQDALGFSYELERSIILSHRSIISATTLINRSASVLALEWFAHPFFALTHGEIRVAVPLGCTLADNPGFELHQTTLTQKRRFAHLTDGHMDFLQLPDHTAPSFRLNHPTVQGVTFGVSFEPSECVIWGNNVTFSIEPYQKLVLQPQESRAWNLRYDFGAAANMV